MTEVLLIKCSGIEDSLGGSGRGLLVRGSSAGVLISVESVEPDAVPDESDVDVGVSSVVSELMDVSPRGGTSGIGTIVGATGTS